MTKITVDGVQITLTSDQLAEIAKQTRKIKTYKDIKRFEDACEVLGISSNIPDFESIDCEDSKMHIALFKLKKIVKAINYLSGFKVNWSDENQRKWYPYFRLNERFSFVVTYNHWNNTDSVVGSRLCVGSDDEATHLGEEFLDLFEDLLK